MKSIFHHFPRAFSSFQLPEIALELRLDLPSQSNNNLVLTSTYQKQYKEGKERRGKLFLKLFFSSFKKAYMRKIPKKMCICAVKKGRIH